MDRKTVLFVDDEPDVHPLMARLLEPVGVRVLHSFNGDEGVMKFVHENIDLVITDLMMPVSGRDVLDVIVHEFPGLPVIVLTGKGDSKTREECIAAGATAYITKPADWMALQKMVADMLSAAEPESQSI